MPSAAYMRKWRNTPEGKESIRRQGERKKAREAALRRLAGQHAHDYLVLYNEELALRDVD